MAKRATSKRLSSDEKIHAMSRGRDALVPIAPASVYGKSFSRTQARLPFTKPKAHSRLAGKVAKFKAQKGSEKDELAVLGALDAAADEGELSTEDAALAERLRAKLYPVIRTDMKSNPTEMDREDLYMAIGGTGLGFASMAAGGLTKNKDIVEFIKQIAAKEKIPVSQVAALDRGILHGLASGYDMGTKAIRTAPSEAIGLHELGHAKDFGAASKLRKALHAGVGSIPILGRFIKKALPAGAAHIPLAPMVAVAPLLSNAVREALKGEDKESIRSKVVSAIEKNPWTIGVAASLPVLKREAVATGFALKQLGKLRGAPGVLKGLASLAPAFGTYAIGSALAGVVTDKAVKYQERMEKARARGMKRLAELEAKK